MLRRVALIAVLALAGCGDLRVKMEVFNTAEDARRAGAFESGWMPRVPASASDLRAGYLPDGRHWGTFSVPVNDAGAVRSLVGEELTSGTLTCDPPGRLEFWPRLLRSPIDVARLRDTGYRLYRGADARTYAINWGQGRVYYWK